MGRDALCAQALVVALGLSSLVVFSTWAAFKGHHYHFGPYLSLDGFHPSSATHRVIADAMIQKVNEFYHTQIPALP